MPPYLYIRLFSSSCCGRQGTRPWEWAGCWLLWRAIIIYNHPVQRISRRSTWPSFYYIHISMLTYILLRYPCTSMYIQLAQNWMGWKPLEVANCCVYTAIHTIYKDNLLNPATTQRSLLLFANTNINNNLPHFRSLPLCPLTHYGQWNGIGNWWVASWLAKTKGHRRCCEHQKKYNRKHSFYYIWLCIGLATIMKRAR